MNKVLYGIKNVHIAKLIEEDGVITYDTPFAVPGATDWAPEPQGSENLFYADNIIYFRSNTNQGYQGDLIVALLPEQFLTEIFGRTVDNNGAVIENADDKNSRFALMFEADGDEKNRRYVYWDCTASRATRGHNTKQESVEPGTDSLPITVAPRSTDNAVGTYLEPTEENQAVYDQFFTQVYEKNATASV